MTSRSSAWRGTTDMQFRKYVLSVPVANTVLEMEILHREAYGRLQDQYQVRAEMYKPCPGNFRLHITRKTWWHIFYKNVIKPDSREFSKKYVVRGNTDLGLTLIGEDGFTTEFLAASPVGLYLKTLNQKKVKADIYGIYDSLPRHLLESVVHIFYKIDNAITSLH